MTDLLDAPAHWVQLLDDEQGVAVLHLDERAADGSPWPGFALALTVSVVLQEPDVQGQPSAPEDERLGDFRLALEAALAGQGRIVAATTIDGVREYLCYLRSDDVVQAWRTVPPAGFDTYEVQVQVQDDPDWQGLRELSGLGGPAARRPGS